MASNLLPPNSNIPLPTNIDDENTFTQQDLTNRALAKGLSYTPNPVNSNSQQAPGVLEGATKTVSGAVSSAVDKLNDFDLYSLVQHYKLPLTAPGAIATAYGNIPEGTITSHLQNIQPGKYNSANSNVIPSAPTSTIMTANPDTFNLNITNDANIRANNTISEAAGGRPNIFVQPANPVIGPNDPRSAGEIMGQAAQDHIDWLNAVNAGKPGEVNQSQLPPNAMNAVANQAPQQPQEAPQQDPAMNAISSAPPAAAAAAPAGSAGGSSGGAVSSGGDGGGDGGDGGDSGGNSNNSSGRK